MSRNVLLVVCDTARADAFEPYGAPPGATPTAAQIASSGQAVEQAFATACWTLPSHASMLTGEMPRALGLGQAPGGSPAGARPIVEAQRERLLAEVLRRAGWDTRAVSANPWVSPYAGFDVGFDEFEFLKAGGRQDQADRTGLDARLRWAYEGLRARTDDGAGEAEAVLARWLSEAGERPFFWFVNLVECHSPYLPPRPYNDLGAVGRLQAAEEARRHLTLEAIWRTCLSDAEVPEAALERMRHLYGRSVRLMDDWLARILEALKDAGRLDDTLVIVTSDHGENFGEGGLLAHAFSLDDRLTRVPLVVNDASFAPDRRPYSLAELPRMVAEAVDLNEHPWGEESGALPTAQFDFIDEEDPRLRIAEEAWNLDERGLAMLTTPLTSVTDGRLKLLRRGDRDELFDLDADKLELRPLDPLAHSQGPRVAALREALNDPVLHREPPVPKGPSAENAREVEDLESRMKLLGYM